MISSVIIITRAVLVTSNTVIRFNLFFLIKSSLPQAGLRQLLGCLVGHSNKNNVDDVVTVKVVSITSYGAFARIVPGVDGLIHISQIAKKHIAKPQDELSVGDEIEVKIIAVDADKKRVSLSRSVLLPDEAPEEAAEVEEVVEEVPVEETAPAIEEAAPEVTEEAAE